MSERPLTTKQRLFVEAYLANPNATAAARTAGYKGNDNTLGAVGRENLQKPTIKKMVEKRVSTAAMSADEVLSELAEIARADWKDFLQINYGKDGEMIDATLKLADKIKALDLLGKHHKLFTEKQEVTHDGGLRVEVCYVDDDPDAEAA